MWAYTDETITGLDGDASGHVPWWPSPEVTLFKVLVTFLTEINRHAGHADILREQLDGTVGLDAESRRTPDAAQVARYAEIERAARAAGA